MVACGCVTICFTPNSKETTSEGRPGRPRTSESQTSASTCVDAGDAARDEGRPLLQLALPLLRLLSVTYKAAKDTNVLVV